MILTLLLSVVSMMGGGNGGDSSGSLPPELVTPPNTLVSPLVGQLEKTYHAPGGGTVTATARDTAPTHGEGPEVRWEDSAGSSSWGPAEANDNATGIKNSPPAETGSVNDDGEWVGSGNSYRYKGGRAQARHTDGKWYTMRPVRKPSEAQVE